MLRYFCHSCGCRLKVKEEMARRKAKCPICSAVNIVPEPSKVTLTGLNPEAEGTRTEAELSETPVTLRRTREKLTPAQEGLESRLQLIHKLRFLHAEGIISRSEFLQMNNRIKKMDMSSIQS